ncbi:MAG: carbohydrate ABC transporter permease [Eubacteriales bacterium]|nr:carbohydrate ABC transporter permease [Eubacteriales bacterium]
MKKPLHHKKKRHLMTRLILTLLALIILIPLVVTFLYSFFSPAEIKAFMGTRGSFDADKWMEVRLSPRVFSLSQYYEILIRDNSILKMFVNSAMYTVGILLGQAVVVPAMAYALSRFNFRGRDVIFFGIIMLMLLPFQVTMVPNVLTLKRLGLLNTVWAVIMPMWFSPFYIFLIRQFMVGLPNELLEAGEMDGCGTIRCYLHIVMPVCSPIIGAAIALSFADCWNLVEQPMTYLSQRTDLQPLSVMFNQLVQNSTGLEFAGATIYILPALFVYLFFLKDILTGVQLTEMK